MSIETEGGGRDWICPSTEPPSPRDEVSYLDVATSVSISLLFVGLTHLLIKDFMGAVPFIELLFLVSAFFIVVTCIAPPIVWMMKLIVKARADYKHSRGTQHLRMLRKSLSSLNQEKWTLQSKEKRLLEGLDNLAHRERAELKRALTDYLVMYRLTDLDGIGPTLRDRIIQVCYNGTLESLKNTNRRVRGIGDEKGWTINYWVNCQEDNMGQYLNEDFPRKDEIIASYARKRSQLKGELTEVKERLSYLEELGGIAESEEHRLSKVGITDFIKAYRSDVVASELVAEHCLGIFPEWGIMPVWFKTLISMYGS